MEHELLSLIITGIICFIVGYLLAKSAIGNMVQQERKDATQQSRKVILWEVNEKIAPILPGFPYHYKDLVFIGKGIDYLVFDGLSEGRLKKIIFLELKSGNSQLNLNEKQIKECIRNNRIWYEVLRISL